jgi:diguanylate cyclase (GGDEF)-like protein
MNSIPDNAELLRENLDRAQRELASLYEISNAMQSSLELNHVLFIILTAVTSHTGLGFNRAILFLFNDQERCLEPKMAIGPESGEHAEKIWKYIDDSHQHLNDLIEKERAQNHISPSSLYDSVKHLKISMDKDETNLLNNAMHEGKAIHILPDEIDQYRSDPLLSTFKTNELIIMPLKAKDKVNGLIVADNLYTQKNISDKELKMFTMLANQAGLAIENAQLYEMVKHRSHTDSLTNLWNHGFFQSQLSNEIERAQASQQPLSLLLLDMDNFKSLNDTYGHQNGDIVLIETGKILKESSRNIDYPCRYGGEEFAVILTQSNEEQAYAVAERIRLRIENHQFPQFHLYDKLAVTVSIGIATFNDSQKKEDLIQQADKAMYHAKFNGKNQTWVFQK